MLSHHDFRRVTHRTIGQRTRGNRAQSAFHATPPFRADGLVRITGNSTIHHIFRPPNTTRTNRAIFPTPPQRLLSVVVRQIRPRGCGLSRLPISVKPVVCAQVPCRQCGSTAVKHEHSHVERPERPRLKPRGSPVGSRHSICLRLPRRNGQGAVVRPAGRVFLRACFGT